MRSDDLATETLEAMATIVLGREPPKYFPQIYLITDERSRKRLRMHHGLSGERKSKELNYRRLAELGLK
jgi:hypothetical protein